MLAKINLAPRDVGAMCHAEVSAWVDSLRASLGVKQQKEIISLRRVKPKLPPATGLKESITKEVNSKELS